MQLLNLVLARRATDVGKDVLEIEVVVRLWLIREVFNSELRVSLSLLFTMGDSFTHFPNGSQLSLFTLLDRRLRHCLFAAQGFYRSQACLLYDPFDDVLARFPRQILTRVSNLYVADGRGINWRQQLTFHFFV